MSKIYFGIHEMDNPVDESELIMNVNYGLFRGVKELQVKDFPGPLHYKLSGKYLVQTFSPVSLDY